MAATNVLLVERLLIGGLLAAMAVAVAFGPELRQAVAKLRRSEPAERHAAGIESSAS